MHNALPCILKIKYIIVLLMEKLLVEYFVKMHLLSYQFVGVYKNQGEIHNGPVHF